MAGTSDGQNFYLLVTFRNSATPNTYLVTYRVTDNSVTQVGSPIPFTGIQEGGSSLAVTNNNSQLILSFLSTGQVLEYDIDPTTGALTSTGTSTFAGTNRLVANPVFNPNSIYSFINPASVQLLDVATGAPTASGSPISIGSGNLIGNTMFDPSGKYYYAITTASFAGAKGISGLVYNNSTGGFTTSITAKSIPSFANPAGIAISGNGNY